MSEDEVLKIISETITAIHASNDNNTLVHDFIKAAVGKLHSGSVGIENAIHMLTTAIVSLNDNSQRLFEAFVFLEKLRRLEGQLDQAREEFLAAEREKRDTAPALRETVYKARRARDQCLQVV